MRPVVLPRPSSLVAAHCLLADNGNVDSAATSLGVHRHPLRSGIAKISEVTGQDLAPVGNRSSRVVGEKCEVFHRDAGVRLPLGSAVVSPPSDDRRTSTERSSLPTASAGVGVRPRSHGRGIEVRFDDGIACDSSIPTACEDFFPDGDAVRWSHPRHDRSSGHRIGGARDCGVLGRERTCGRRLGARRAVEAWRRSSSYRRVNVVLEFSHVA
ncbi:helix-turn-helix domain-containing protein [Rhodococcus pyridinivorans]|uniref:helix-turn-helix domain-containing protein n=1 Tax=Rhodococcus pyridinivorans TaxID=103816 RepID=UPI003556F228